MAISLIDFLTPLKTTNVNVVVKNLELENICKIYADSVSSIDNELAIRTVNRWDIIRNNLLVVYLNEPEEPIETIPVTGVELDNSTLQLNIGDTFTLVATVTPSDATNQNITWLSSNSDIVTVDNGAITSIAEGSATIVVTTEDGGFTATCEVTVSEIEQIVSVESITLSESTIDLVVGDESVQLIATVIPENATDKSVSWGTSNEQIATVVDGLVTPVSEGTAVISAITNDGGFIATCNVNVSTVIPVVEVESVTLNESNINIVLGTTDFPNLVATVNPSDATYDEVVWTSSDESVVTVLDGILTPIEVGIANIIATVNGVDSEPCIVTVTTE